MRRFALAGAALLSVAGCASDGAGGASRTDGGRDAAPDGAELSRRGGVVTYATFGRIVDADAGTADGVNVDDRTSDGSEPETCKQRDFVAPDGREGIDNAFGNLVPIIENLAGKENVQALLETAIKNGQLLIVLGLGDVDSLVNDDHVTLRLGAGSGAPYVDENGDYDPYQTFGFAVSPPVSDFAQAAIVDGVLVAGPSDITLPVRVLDANFDLAIHSAHLRMSITEDPLDHGLTMTGVVGGGLVVAQLSDVVKGLNVSQDIITLVPGFAGRYADLAPDANGKCTEISAALLVSTTAAYVDP